MESALEVSLIIAFLIIIILLGVYLYVINKDIKEIDKRRRKINKELLKFISKKQNKTY